MVVTEIPRHVEKTDYCYACQGTKLITDTYTCELICANCGLVVTDKVGDRQIYGQKVIQFLHFQINYVVMIWDSTRIFGLSLKMLMDIHWIL